MEARELRRMTVAAYVALDRSSEARWEYASGEAWVMGGASPEHAVVARNVIVELTNALRGKPCLALPDGQKLATTRTRGYHYPDAMVVCAQPHYDAEDDRAITNPTLLVEVLSPTTVAAGSSRSFGRSIRSRRSCSCRGTPG